MLFSITQIIMITAFTVLQFLTHTSASWLYPPYEPPVVSESTVLATCIGWITFYGFDENNVEFNRNLAKQRAKDHDNDRSVFAVIYAQILVAFPLAGTAYDFGPINFCERHRGFNEHTEIKSLILTEKTCEGWIRFYKYSRDLGGINKSHADDRNINEDFNVSVWAAGYARFLASRERNDAISVIEYCSGVGLSGDHNMTYMSFNGTTKTCHEWVELSEYGTDMNANKRKFRAHKQQFFTYLNSSTQRYIDHLRKYYAPKWGFGCASSSACELDDGAQTPEEFCNNERFTVDVPLTYYF